MIGRLGAAGAALMILASCGEGAGTAVPRTDAEKQALASEIATLVSDPRMFDGMMDAMKASMLPMLDRACESVPAEAQADCAAKLQTVQPVVLESFDESMEQVKALMPEMMQDMGAVMARVYTGEELAKMMDFQTSPEGKSITAKQPQVLAEYMPKAMERMSAIQVDIMRKTQERVLKALEDAGVPPPSPSPI